MSLVHNTSFYIKLHIEKNQKKKRPVYTTDRGGVTAKRIFESDIIQRIDATVSFENNKPKFNNPMLAAEIAMEGFKETALKVVDWIRDIIRRVVNFMKKMWAKLKYKFSNFTKAIESALKLKNQYFNLGKEIRDETELTEVIYVLWVTENQNSNIVSSIMCLESDKTTTLDVVIADEKIIDVKAVTSNLKNMVKEFKLIAKPVSTKPMSLDEAKALVGKHISEIANKDISRFNLDNLQLSVDLLRNLAINELDSFNNITDEVKSAMKEVLSKCRIVVDKDMKVIRYDEKYLTELLSKYNENVAKKVLLVYKNLVQKAAEKVNEIVKIKDQFKAESDSDFERYFQEDDAGKAKAIEIVDAVLVDAKSDGDSDDGGSQITGAEKLFKHFTDNADSLKKSLDQVRSQISSKKLENKYVDLLSDLNKFLESALNGSIDKNILENFFKNQKAMTIKKDQKLFATEETLPNDGYIIPLASVFSFGSGIKLSLLIGEKDGDSIKTSIKEIEIPMANQDDLQAAIKEALGNKENSYPIKFSPNELKSIEKPFMDLFKALVDTADVANKKAMETIDKIFKELNKVGNTLDKVKSKNSLGDDAEKAKATKDVLGTMGKTIPQISKGALNMIPNLIRSNLAMVKTMSKFTTSEKQTDKTDSGSKATE